MLKIKKIGVWNSNVKLDKYNDTTDEYDFQEDEVEWIELN